MKVKFNKYIVSYPVVIHKDEKSDYGVTIPDLPGCFSSGCTMDEALKNAKEAIECHINGMVMDSEEISEPKTVEYHLNNPDYKDGTWALVEFDYGKINNPMKIQYKRVNITLPSHVLRRIDQYTEVHHTSRSSFITQASIQAMAGE